MRESSSVRKFEGGATRDTIEGKLSYVKALCPNVLRCYMEYLGRHRLQSDGNMREWDNWKQGMPQEVYLDGLGRHFWNVWLLLCSYEAYDNHGAVTLEDSLCGVIFNAMGILYEELSKDVVKGVNKAKNSENV